METHKMTHVQFIDTCEVCGNDQLVPVLDLGEQPMCDDLVPIGNPARPTPYPLKLLGCRRCITVHQAFQVEKKALFPMDYHYRAALTKDVVDGMRELVQAVAEQVGSLSGRTVLDIGCNDGSLLSIFGEFGARTCGVEPTGAAQDAKPKLDWLHNGFFDAAAVEVYLAENEKPDIITFTNVFAHIEDLNGLILNLRRLMTPDTKVVIENHYLGAVVEQAQFDTFYHEHPRTYSFRSFEFIAEKLGGGIEFVEFPERYNGNIRVIIGTSPADATPDIDESDFIAGVAKMPALVEEGRIKTQERLRALVAKHGPLPAKAFPGRAAILMHSLGIDETLIDATYERSNSPKVGHYVPGTDIEIRDEAEFFAERMDAPVLINFAWHIQPEIERYMRAQGYQGQVLPIWE
ncbi:MAG: class I SAM-dependent methyltransferase [Pseudomonadota bacterium]